MKPRIRKLMLTAHVVSTVGWMGAIAAFLVLAVTGLTTLDSRRVDSAYVAMKLIGWRVIVPLGVASLLTGLVQSLGTTWGLFRHYWVLLKGVLTVVATFLLLLHMSLVDRLADLSDMVEPSASHLHSLRIQITADAAGAIVLLIINTILSIYKPRGMTRYGLRKQRAERGQVGSDAVTIPGLDNVGIAPRWVKVFGISGVALLVLFRIVIIHVSGGRGHHFH